MRVTWPIAVSCALIACVPDSRRGARSRGDAGATPVDASQLADAGTQAGADAEVAEPDAAEPIPDSGVPPPDAGDLCIDGPQKLPRSNVFFGTDLPSHVPLTSGQITAIGTFFGCSGVVISPTWVLTAKHCGLDSTTAFCIGTAPDDPNACIDAQRVVDHPAGDMTLVELVQPATDVLPGVEPVPILLENLDQTWVGRTAEASGYGQDENGDSGRREFTAEPISDVSGDEITIDGQGIHGVCFGDSGGPLMVIASDGAVRVAGALSYGDESCVGMDHFARVDTYRAWIETYVPATPIGPQPCGTVTAEGSCSDDRRRATWCGANDELAIESCAATHVCGWSAADSGFRCIPNADDPCEGLSFDGECRSNVLRWCDRGVLLERACSACGETCLPRENQGGFFCVESSCGDVDHLGKCEGSVAVWCNLEGSLERRDCAAFGESCGYIDDQIGWFCQ
jgi:hypothetical protein